MPYKRILIALFFVCLISLGIPIISASADETAAVIYKSGHITQNEVWRAGNIYVIQDNVTVDQGVTLIIQPGTTVKFVENKLLGVYGILRIGMDSANAQSTHSANFDHVCYLPLALKGYEYAEKCSIIQVSVIITSIRDDTVGGDTNGDGNATSPQAGDWGHIAFFDSSADSENFVQNALIRYGGYFHNHGNEYYDCWDCQYWGAVRFDSASPTIKGNQLRENRGYALSASVDSFPSVSCNQLYLNQGNGLEIRQGTLSTVTPVVYHWNNTDIVYALTGFTTIGPGVTLQIDPGVIVKLNENRLIGVNGVLKVMGTVMKPVTISSLKDDESGGDTNGDGNATAPEAGNWGHIAFFDSSVDSENLIQNARIRYGGYFHNYGNDYYDCWYCEYWGAVRFDSASPTIKGNTINENQGYALSASVDSFPVVSSNQLYLNQGNGLEIRQGTLSTVTPVVYHWNNTDIVYALTGFTTVGSGVTLQIDPGVIVKVNANRLIGVNGVLKVVGTPTNPVTITSMKDDTAGGDTNGDGTASAPEAGNWGHISFLDSSVDSENLIQNARIRYGGYFHNYGNEYYDCWYCEYWGAVRFDSASPTIKNNVLNKNRGYALSASVDSFPVVSSNQLELNDGNGLEIRGGTLSTVTPVVYHWNNTGIVYALPGYTTVGSGVTLQIDPGVIVKVNANRLIGVNGVLKVMGTPSNPVTITSLKDDAAGGDTNGDGSATAPAPGDWGHISFLDSSVDSENLVQNALIRYGGYFHNYGNEYYDCWYCQYNGAIYIQSASPTIQDSLITLNNEGIRTDSGSQPTINHNSISGNVTFGLNNLDLTVTVVAENNWWGDASGPYNLAGNPGGLGNQVSDFVDFDPWLPAAP